MNIFDFGFFVSLVVGYFFGFQAWLATLFVEVLFLYVFLKYGG